MGGKPLLQGAGLIVHRGQAQFNRFASLHGIDYGATDLALFAGNGEWRVLNVGSEHVETLQFAAAH
ncbi:MAG: hypothetical protein ACD_10C00452G0001 [uncultured bacterium]|nr:MAG: hypothetical protein ACD_10C00452G0001 [uncultured bacterium]